jgi:hypothetical protein
MARTSHDIPAVPDAGDLLFRASIEDQTYKFFEDFDDRLDNMERRTSNGFKGVEESVDNAGLKMGMVGGIIGGLTMKLVEMAEAGVDAFFNFAKSSADLRARVDTLGVSLNIAGRNAGYTADQLAAFEESVKSRGITTQQTRDALIQMAQSELDLSKASDLARVSQDAAVNAGITSAQAFERITSAIVTLQPEILRNMNITVDLQSAYTRYAATVGKTAEQLTYTERKQVALNEVLRQGQVIAGTYEAAMGTVGKQLTSLPRYQEEISMIFGGLFQAGYLQGVTTYKELLADILDFLKAHQSELEATAASAGDLISILLDTIKQAMSQIASVGDMAWQSISQLFELLSTNPQAMSDFLDSLTDVAGILDTATKSVILVRAGFTALFKAWEQGVQIGLNLLTIVKAAASINPLDPSSINANTIAEAMQARDAISDTFKVDKWQQVQDWFNESVRESTELIKENETATENAGEATSKYAEIQANKLADALSLANAKLKQMKESMEDDALERQIKAQRDAIEEELRGQWAKEDMARTHAERIRQIMEGSEDSKTHLLEQANEARLNAEEDYRKRLQQIQEEFNFNASELARRRDAVGLLALIRSNKRQLEQEKKTYEDSRKKAQENFDKAMEQINATMQEQLAKAEEARVKELESYQRNLDRQRQLKELHDQWAQEDRDRQTRKMLDDMVKQFAGMDAVTREGLQTLLDDWGGYFKALGEAINSYYSGMSGGGTSGGSDEIISNPGGGEAGSSVTEDLHDQEIRDNRDYDNDGKIGQAGLVSSMLTPTTMTASALGSMPPSPARVPSVGGSNREAVDITVKLDAPQMEPYIQRVVLNTLYEIERARNGKSIRA